MEKVATQTFRKWIRAENCFESTQKLHKRRIQANEFLNYVAIPKLSFQNDYKLWSKTNYQIIRLENLSMLLEFESKKQKFQIQLREFRKIYF